jgi:hypothetical protein
MIYDKRTIALAGLAVICVLALFFTRNVKENFTIVEREGLLCHPFVNNRETNLMPNSIVIIVQGYNYVDTPKILRDGRVIIPLQYAWDSDSLAYYFIVYAPKGMCGSNWMLETSDHVKPVVIEGRNNKDFIVNLEKRNEGHHMWSLSC